MIIAQNVRAIAISVLGLTSLVIPASAEQPMKLEFSDETVGADPKSLVPLVGIWRIESEGGKNVLAVDGGSGRRDSPPPDSRQSEGAVWRALRRVSRPGQGIRLLPLCRGK